MGIHYFFYYQIFIIMSVISEHPQKAEIEALIKSNSYSYRELQSELLSRFNCKISYNNIQKYHQNQLGGVFDFEKENEEGSPTETIVLDQEQISRLVKELSLDAPFMDAKETLKNEITELFAIQLQITKHALLQHTKGLGRYPSEYVRNLMLFSNLLLK